MARPRANVQVVDVLGDDSATSLPLRAFGNYSMRRVWLTAGNRPPSPVVPLPDERRITSKRLGRGECFGSEISPEPVGPAKGRHAARGGHTGARKDGEPPGVAQAAGEGIRYQDSRIRAGQDAPE